MTTAKVLVDAVVRRISVDAPAGSGQCGETEGKPMTSWMKERDRLLEQTLAFVQGVTAKRPITVTSAAQATAPALETHAVSDASIVLNEAAINEAAIANHAHAAGKILIDTSSAETDALISLMALSQPARDSASNGHTPELIVPADVPQPIRVTAKPPVHQPAARRPVDMVLPERELIAQRVARFRAAQQKTLQDREINYEAVQAKIRATLGNDPFE